MTRITAYTTEIGQKVCAALVESESGKNSLRAVCKKPGMPSRSTVYRWLEDHPEFVVMYGKATTARAHGYVDEMVDIADAAPETKEGVQKAKLRIYAREKYAAKIAPRLYGEKVQTEVTGGLTVNSVKDLTDEQLAAIAAGSGARTAGQA